MVHFDTDTRPGALRLFVRGQLDMTAESVFNEALISAGRFRRPVELDLSEVDFIDGSGLSILIEAERRARGTGRQLTIVNASRAVHRLIEITGTADRLPPISAPESPAVTSGVDAPGEIVSRTEATGTRRLG
jgi:anti-sigma B factor antagonist